MTTNDAHRSRESARLAAEERSIPMAELRTADRPSENVHLVAEHGVLELELRDAPRTGEHSHEAYEQEVDERSQGAKMLPASSTERRTEFWSPTGHR